MAKSENSANSLNILFVPLDSTGHINACIGIAQQLQSLGHRVTFALERSWTGQLERRGFAESIYTDHTRAPGLGPNEHWLKSMDMILDTMHESSLYKAGHQNPKEFEEFLFNELQFDDQIATMIEKVRPDIIVVDNYVTIPAVYKCGRPWAMMTSANPLQVISSPDTPPPNSGYSIESDRKLWQEFEQTQIVHYGPIVEKFRKAILAYGDIPDFPDEGSVFHASPYLNIYAFPEELDYLDIRPLPPNWKRFDHFIRRRDGDGDGDGDDDQNRLKWNLPEKLIRCNNRNEKLIYVSMGSMGCADQRLMRRLITIFRKSKYRFIMVLGPNYDTLQAELPDNIWADRSVPQVDVLPHVDAVLTHGGNNSVLESMLAGKPMIVNPLFGDQYCNAERVTAKRFGVRINAYTCTEDELIGAIDRVTSDREMAANLAAASARMARSRSTEMAAKAIVEIAGRNNNNNNNK